MIQTIQVAELRYATATLHCTPNFVRNNPPLLEERKNARQKLFIVHEIRKMPGAAKKPSALWYFESIHSVDPL
jgi:hypothetical protein